MIINTGRLSEVKRRSMPGRTFAALIVSISMLSAAIMLSTMTNDSLAQPSNANTTASSSSGGGGQGTAAAGLSLNCQAIASRIGGIVIPNPSKICDVLIPRQAPTIIGPGNMNMNKFSTINSIVEVGAISDLMVKSNASSSGTNGGGGGGGGGSSNRGQIGGGASSSSNSSQQVFAMGEFSLLDPQLITMVKSTAGYNWTIAAIHNHMVLEKPKMMFVHWSAQGDLNTITNQIKNVLLVLSKVPSSSGSS
jgi:Domain of Unknown Function (DUF1259)